MINQQEKSEIYTRRDFLLTAAAVAISPLSSSINRLDSYFTEKKIITTPLREIYRDELDVWPPGTLRWASYKKLEDGTIILRTHDESYPIPREALPASGLYRDPQHYTETIQYLNPLQSLRYQPVMETPKGEDKGGEPYTAMTYCNIWAGDVTACFRVAIPRWLNGKKTNAESIITMLSGDIGSFLGWKETNFFNAQGFANEGIPTVLAEPRHIAVVMPGPNPHDPLLANVGRIVAMQIPASGIWGGDHLSNLRCFYNSSGGYEFLPDNFPGEKTVFSW
jgi:hypothetical protein